MCRYYLIKNPALIRHRHPLICLPELVRDLPTWRSYQSRLPQVRLHHRWNGVLKVDAENRNIALLLRERYSSAMNAVSVRDASHALGVSNQRVRAMLADGQLRGNKVGGVWLVELPDQRSGHLRPPRRPMSATQAWNALAILSDIPFEMDSSARSRLRSRIRRGLVDCGANNEKLAGVSRAWFRQRSKPEGFFVASVPFAQLSKDPRVYRSGVSHIDSPVRDAKFLEAYVELAALKPLIRDYAMVSDVKANVLLRVVSNPVGTKLLHSDSFPKACIAADLAEHDDQRSIGAAADLLRGWKDL